MIRSSELCGGQASRVSLGHQNRTEDRDGREVTGAETPLCE